MLNFNRSQILTTLALISATLAPTVSHAALPYVMMIDTHTVPADPKYKKAVTDAVIYYLTRDLSRAAQQVLEENSAGLKGAQALVKKVVDGKPTVVTAPYSVGTMLHNPTGLFLRSARAYDERFTNSLRAIESIMARYGGRGFTDTESGAAGYWPTSATVRLVMMPWASSTRPAGAQTIFDSTGSAKTPAAVAFQTLAKIPFIMTDVESLSVAPMPDYSGPEGQAKLRQLQYDGFMAGVKANTAGKPLWSEFAPKGLSAEIQLSGSGQSSRSVSYLSVLASRATPVDLDYVSDAADQGVYIRKFEYAPYRKPNDAAIQLTVFRALKPGITPYVAMTFGRVENKAAKDSKLVPTTAAYELAVSPGTDEQLPQFNGFLDKNAIKLPLKVPFQMYFERVLISLKDFSIIPSTTTYPFEWRGKTIETKFRYGTTIAKFKVMLPSIFARPLTQQKVAPAINERIQAMLPSPGTK